MSDAKATWLPNLVGGVSIWKLARDLNEPQFFDGRLLVPETEGSDSLPVNVRWDVTGLTPLPEARAAHPADAQAAVADFVACLERVARELASPSSGYHKFKDAFSVPGLEADGGKHYFYSPARKKLYVVNWGASPRELAGRQQLVFGYDSFQQLIGAARAAAVVSAPTALTPGAAVALETPAAAVVAALASPEAKPAEGENKDDKKDETKKNKKALPWWAWVLAAVAIAGLGALIVVLLRACQEPGSSADAAAESSTDAPADALALADRAAQAIVDGAKDGNGDAAHDARDDARSDGGRDAADDARGRDARSDGAGGGGNEGPGGSGDGPGSGGGAGGGGPGGGGPAGSATIVVVPGGAGAGGGAPGASPSLHFDQPSATHWRVVAGRDQLDPGSAIQGDGAAFDVVLKPGGSFDRVKVQWQDGSGKWHQ